MERTVVAVQGAHRIEIGGYGDHANLELRYKCIRDLPPIGKQKRYLELNFVVLHACERDESRDRARIYWKLITLRWYAMRWKTETFHKVFGSGCHVKGALLRSCYTFAQLRHFFFSLSPKTKLRGINGLA